MVTQASLAVVPGGSVFTQTNKTTGRVGRLFGNTNIGVAVTVTSPSNLEVRDPVVERLQRRRVREVLLSENVEADERNSAKPNHSRRISNENVLT